MNDSELNAKILQIRQAGAADRSGSLSKALVQGAVQGVIAGAIVGAAYSIYVKVTSN